LQSWKERRKRGRKDGEGKIGKGEQRSRLGCLVLRWVFEGCCERRRFVTMRRLRSREEGRTEDSGGRRRRGRRAWRVRVCGGRRVDLLGLRGMVGVVVEEMLDPNRVQKGVSGRVRKGKREERATDRRTSYEIVLVLVQVLKGWIELQRLGMSRVKGERRRRSAAVSQA
jgi:hypothetical protein